MKKAVGENWFETDGAQSWTLSSGADIGSSRHTLWRTASKQFVEESDGAFGYRIQAISVEDALGLLTQYEQHIPDDLLDDGKRL